MKTITAAALGLLVSSALFSTVSQAVSRAPVVPSHTMTCEEAVAFYAKYKRIYVLAHGKDLVPIYGMKPISELGRLNCGGKKSHVGYSVRTKDARRCYVAAFCSG